MFIYKHYAMDRHCDKCNLEVPRGTVLSTLCVNEAAHHLVDNVSGKTTIICSSFIIFFPSFHLLSLALSNPIPPTFMIHMMTHHT
jgi:hypothetical protein